MEYINELRKKVISQFVGVTIDMDYLLCIPSIHGKYQKEEITVDYGGNIRSISDAFPEDKVACIIKWVKLHKEEIENNHSRINSSHKEPLMIEPLQAQYETDKF